MKLTDPLLTDAEVFAAVRRLVAQFRKSGYYPPYTLHVPPPVLQQLTRQQFEWLEDVGVEVKERPTLKQVVSISCETGQFRHRRSGRRLNW